MRRTNFMFGFLLFALVAAPLAFATPAAAKMLRTFEGELQKIKGSKIIVDNKKGDKITFNKVDETEVSGEKEAWDDLKKNDWVTVHSDMFEKPRKAYKIEVMPDPKDEAEDED